MKKVINVTATDIKKGRQGDCHICPIAKAALRAFKYLAPCTVSVGDYVTVFSAEGTRLVWAELPEVATKFISKFDKAACVGKQFKPFKFTVNFK